MIPDTFAGALIAAFEAAGVPRERLEEISHHAQELDKQAEEVTDLSLLRRNFVSLVEDAIATLRNEARDPGFLGSVFHPCHYEWEAGEVAVQLLAGLLNELGRQGWEVHSVHNTTMEGSDATYFAYVLRRMRDEEAEEIPTPDCEVTK